MSARAAKIAAVIIRTLRACVAVFPRGAGLRRDGRRRRLVVPRTLDSCAAAIAPRVAFPSESPSRPTGPGAVVWVEDARCLASPQAGGFALAEAALGRDDRPAATAQPVFKGAATALDAAGASEGRVAVAAVPAGSAPALIAEGKAPTHGRWPRCRPRLRFSARPRVPGRLGDRDPRAGARDRRAGRALLPLGLRDPRLRVRRSIRAVSALVSTMDYRSDVLLAWQRTARSTRPCSRSVWPSRHSASSRARRTRSRALSATTATGWSPGRAPKALRRGRRACGSPSPRRRALRREQADASFATGRRRAGAGSCARRALPTENVMLAWTDAR